MSPFVCLLSFADTDDPMGEVLFNWNGLPRVIQVIIFSFFPFRNAIRAIRISKVFNDGDLAIVKQALRYPRVVLFTKCIHAIAIQIRLCPRVIDYRFVCEAEYVHVVRHVVLIASLRKGLFAGLAGISERLFATPSITQHTLQGGLTPPFRGTMILAPPLPKRVFFSEHSLFFKT